MGEHCLDELLDLNGLDLRIHSMSGYHLQRASTRAWRAAIAANFSGQSEKERKGAKRGQEAVK